MAKNARSLNCDPAQGSGCLVFRAAEVTRGPRCCPARRRSWGGMRNESFRGSPTSPAGQRAWTPCDVARARAGVLRCRPSWWTVSFRPQVAGPRSSAEPFPAAPGIQRSPSRRTRGVGLSIYDRWCAFSPGRDWLVRPGCVGSGQWRGPDQAGTSAKHLKPSFNDSAQSAGRRCRPAQASARARRSDGDTAVDDADDQRVVDRDGDISSLGGRVGWCRLRVHAAWSTPSWQIMTGRVSRPLTRRAHRQQPSSRRLRRRPSQAPGGVINSSGCAVIWRRLHSRLPPDAGTGSMSKSWTVGADEPTGQGRMAVGRSALVV